MFAYSYFSEISIMAHTVMSSQLHVPINLRKTISYGSHRAAYLSLILCSIFCGVSRRKLMRLRSFLEASGLILVRKPTVLSEIGFFSPVRKMHGEDITVGSSFPVQNSPLLS
jgi:hypothetical protein